MAVETYDGITSFDQWYVGYEPNGRGDALEWRTMADCAAAIWREYEDFKREMDARVGNYHVLEKLADAEVISPKPDLPNVSSGEVAGLIRRTARALVQNTPNVEVTSKFDNDDVYGIFSKHVLTTKIIGSDYYSNDMQQNLFASVKTAFALGFACVVPVLLRDPKSSWYMKYDPIHYRDVFPEPGVKDIRDTPIVFVRRYLSYGEVMQLIRRPQPGWDVQALKAMAAVKPPNREEQSTSHQDKKHKMIPKGYEVITRYDNSGQNFITFEGRTKMLLRIEKNKHPLKQHPVHFLVLEKDENQPLGKSQIELVIGRQDFQDLMLNGAMKLWYRNINPSIFGYGTVNSIPNLGPGKYTQISNPNAKVEAFEVNTQTLMQYGSISQNNLGSMVSMIGASDQQMSQQSGGGNGMSATPQGVDAQTAVVDVTTNNFQKAIESFFSHYCSYALTIYFAELAATQKVELTADARMKLLEAGLPMKDVVDPATGKVLEKSCLHEDGTLDIEFDRLAGEEYWVKCIPGSLTELEDEKQLRILNQLFIPLSQALGALSNAGDIEALKNASKAMSYITAKQIELSGSSSAKDIGLILKTGDVDEVSERDQRIQALEDQLAGNSEEREIEAALNHEMMTRLQEQMSLMVENNTLLLQKLGVTNEAPAEDSASEAPIPVA